MINACPNAGDVIVALECDIGGRGGDGSAFSYHAPYKWDIGIQRGAVAMVMCTLAPDVLLRERILLLMSDSTIVCISMISVMYWWRAIRHGD